MDPNETLRELRDLVTVEFGIATGGQWSADAANERLAFAAERIDALDEWLTSGGFLPEAWAQR